MAHATPSPRPGGAIAPADNAVPRERGCGPRAAAVVIRLQGCGRRQGLRSCSRNSGDRREGTLPGPTGTGINLGASSLLPFSFVFSALEGKGPQSPALCRPVPSATCKVDRIPARSGAGKTSDSARPGTPREMRGPRAAGRPSHAGRRSRGGGGGRARGETLCVHLRKNQ